MLVLGEPFSPVVLLGAAVIVVAVAYAHADMKPLHDDIPLRRAWQEGRRVYVRCSRDTRFFRRLHRLGAKWDEGRSALWVGSAKRDQVVELVLAMLEARAVMNEGRWADIPYDATEIHDHALFGLRAVHDEKTGRYAMRTDEHLAEITRLVRVWHDGGKSPK
ncbi:hypothetical protein ACFOY2_48340 [Nonomuraea purpurea]|uniref:Uncharacterized protein n=2 Tax=Nonomuraea purpurea TaxID=1849276 RepID=A0ABV8GQ82_9ACTN